MSNIYFFNFKAQIAHLKSGKQTNAEGYLYFLAFFLFDMIPDFGRSTRDVVPSHPVGTIIGAVVVALIGWVTLRAYYRANGGDGGHHFLHRLFALGWVIWMQITALCLPFLFIFKAFPAAQMDSTLTGGLAVGFVVLFLGGLFYFNNKMLNAFYEISS